MPDLTPDDEVQLTRPGRANSGAVGTSPSRAGVGSRFWMIPALTFLVGLLLGGVLVAAVTSGGDGGGQASGLTQSPPATTDTATGRAPATVTVPGPCLDVADSADEVVELVRRAATAARDLNASELSSVVREIQEKQDDLAQKSSACRSAAA